jgi:hypothetical protein
MINGSYGNEGRKRDGAGYAGDCPGAKNILTSVKSPPKFRIFAVFFASFSQPSNGTIDCISLEQGAGTPRFTP